jgi:ketosteroid isomerase-like protein
MLRENVQVIRRCWEAISHGGPEALLDFADPEIEWHVRSDLPDADVYRGPDGFRALLQRFDESFDDQQYEPLDYIAAGEEAVVVPLRWSARGRGSGATAVERQETWVFTVTEGRITRVDEYPTREEALESVGLLE